MLRTLRDGSYEHEPQPNKPRSRGTRPGFFYDWGEMTRESKPTNYVYRVTIEHLYNDGVGHYLERTYGPYTSLTAAKSQETRLLRMARDGGKKANSFIEESWLEWEVRA